MSCYAHSPYHSYYRRERITHSRNSSQRNKNTEEYNARFESTRTIRGNFSAQTNKRSHTPLNHPFSLSQQNEIFDEIRQNLASIQSNLDQLDYRVGRLESLPRRRTTKSPSPTTETFHLAPTTPEQIQELPKVDPRSIQAASLCVTPHEVDSAVQEEEPTLLLVSKEEEDKIDQAVRKGEPVLLLIPKEEEGEIQSEGNLPGDSQLVLKEFQEVSSDELLSGLTPFHESKLSSTCPIDREAVRDGQTDQFVIKLEGRQCQLSPLTPAHIQELRNSIPRSTPTTILLLMTKEVDRTSPVKKIFFNIVFFCRLVRLGRRFLKDRGRKRISYNPRAWVWDHFRQGKAPFQEGENDEVIPSSKDQSLALMALSSTLDGIDIGDQ